MKEIWKDIIGFEEYQISNLGRVKSKERMIEIHHTNNGAYEYPIKERILKASGKRYLGVSLIKDNKRYYPNIHRLVALHFITNTNNKKIVNHMDGNKLNNRVDNLEWSTHSENSIHAHKVLGVKSNLINWNKIK